MTKPPLFASGGKTYSLKKNFFLNVGDRFFGRKADLLHAVAVAQRNGAVFQRIEIDR